MCICLRVSFFLSLAAPDVAPGNVGISSKSSTFLTIQWDAIAREKAHGTIQHYIVEFRLHGKEKKGNWTKTTTTKLTKTLTGLKPYTTYDVRVAAKTVDRGPYSDVRNFTTAEGGVLYMSVVCSYF